MSASGVRSRYERLFRERQAAAAVRDQCSSQYYWSQGQDVCNDRVCRKSLRSHLEQATCTPQDTDHDPDACMQLTAGIHTCHGQAQQDDGSGAPGEEAPGAGAVPVRTPFQGAISTIFTKHLS